VREGAARLRGSVSLGDGIDGKGCAFIVAIVAPRGSASIPTDRARASIVPVDHPFP
jgi:hypothetical protein